MTVHRPLTIPTGCGRLVATCTVVGLLAAATVLGPASPGIAATQDDTPSATTALDATTETLLRTALAAPQTGIVGTLIVVRFGDAGPIVRELDVRADPGGGMQVRGASAWVFTRTAEEAFAQPIGQDPLRLGAVTDAAGDLGSLLANYDVEVEGTRQLDTGEAVGIALRSRGDGGLRERFWVDEAVGTLVRRETYGADGRPRRLAAFTSLHAVDRRRVPPPPQARSLSMETMGLDADAVATLGRTGWAAPEQLAGGFVRRDAYAMGDGEASSLHLVYSDGLYAMSVYEQRGMLSSGGLVDASLVASDEMQVWRWPGAVPERLVWTDGSMTYTVVTDAPFELVMPALHDLPHDAAPSVPGRLRRGLERVASWLNPFG